MKLEEVRRMLEECEMSIIYYTVERSKHYISRDIYEKDNKFITLFEKNELIHSIYERYQNPVEYPFTTVTTIKKINHYKYPLSSFLSSDPNIININYNNIILKNYTKILDNINVIDVNLNKYDNLEICNVNTIDINLLQIISKRCHLGKVVAEIKYRNDKDLYDKSNRKEMYKHLTNLNVENKILERVKGKTENFLSGCCLEFDNCEKIPNFITMIFKNIIIPITKEIQLDYLELRKNINR